MKHFPRYFLLLLCFSWAWQAFGQKADEKEEMYLSYKSTLLGVGTYSARDTYLSPQEYSGRGLKLLSDNMRMRPWMEGRISTQRLIHVDVSSYTNQVESASAYGALFDYGYAAHYHLTPVLPGLRLMAGPQFNMNTGALYNTRNGNNPVSAKLGLNLGLSALADYRFHILRQPVSVRYQADMPMLGYLFSPHFGQSYYEISLGNSDGLLHFATFGRQFSLKNYLTLELPFKPLTLRLTYLNTTFQSEINGLKTALSSNVLMLGLVKEVFSIPRGKQLKDVEYRRVFD